MQAVQIQSDQLGESQAGGIEQLHDRPVASDEGIAGRNLEQACHLVRIEGHRQFAPRLGRTDLATRIALDRGDARIVAVFELAAWTSARQAFAHQEVIEAAHGRHAPLNAARPETGRMQARSEVPERVVRQRAPLFDLFTIAVRNERSQIACVVGVSVRRIPALGSQIAAKARNPLERRGSHEPLVPLRTISERVGRSTRR